MAELAVKRPVFITCAVFLMIAVGLISMRRLGVDLFPDVTFPVVFVSVPYPGAGPSEIETLVAKPLEDELSTIAGLKRVSAVAKEGVAIVIAEFMLETDVKFAEQQIRDRVGAAKRKLPKEINEPVIRRLDPSEQPIAIVSLKADLPPAEIYDLANEIIRPRIERVNQVGLVEVLGGRRREIHVNLEREKLKNREISAGQVAQRIASAGENVPVGTVNESSQETVFRTMGQFNTLDDVKKTIVNFFGNDVPVRVSDVATVKNGLADEGSRAYLNGERSLFLYVFRQSGANTVAVADNVIRRVVEVNALIEKLPGNPRLQVVRDGAVWIRANITDVKESIFIGILLAILVVFFYLGSIRSTIITGLALPNSLIGAFILMALAGFTVNIMSLLALSLSVGLLIDDAIVVRENIYRHIEMGKPPVQAALTGTAEVRLAVIATTLCIIAVFGPIGFLKGVTGQFFKQFGLTVCFAMLISLFDALTIAPMLSAYFAGKAHTTGGIVKKFEDFQIWLDGRYEKSINFTLRRPLVVLFISLMITLGAGVTLKYVPKTFMPTQDNGEFMVDLDLPPGANLETMAQSALKVDAMIRSNPEVELTSMTVGSRDSESNTANLYVKLVPAKKRKLNTSKFKDRLRGQLKVYQHVNPRVKDYDVVGGGHRPFTINIAGNEMKELEKTGLEVLKILKKHPGLKDADISFRSGKPEFQVAIQDELASRFGVSTKTVGDELRTLVSGSTSAKFRENGKEYDIVVRLKEDQRNLKEGFNKTFVPNINGSLVALALIAKPVEAVGPAKITRQDRGRYVQISADITPGAGLSQIMTDIHEMFATTLKLPRGLTYAFVGQAENFKELGESVAVAIGLGVLFIYLVLASLYESFVIPFTIMLALPLAIVGSFVALFIAGESLNIFSMIGTVMLLGVATKNSILLVDYANQQLALGVSRTEAMLLATKTRLRPILMTTMALIAGTIPIALGLNEASRQRTSMGVAIIGGLISSTLLTLFVVPAAFSYIDRFRVWSGKIMKAIFR